MLCSSAFAGTIYIYKNDKGSTLISEQPRSLTGYELVKKKHYRNKSVSPNYSNARPIDSDFSLIINAAATKESLNVSLIHAVVHVESAFKNNAVSPREAQGLMQLMPTTARFLGVKDPFNPRENIFAGTQHLANLISDLGNVDLALAAYNAGKDAVNRYQGIPPFPETQQYVRRVNFLEKIYRQKFEQNE